MHDLNGKKFVPVTNENGRSSPKTVFHYFQTEQVITGHYSGGQILQGQFIGEIHPDGTLRILFQCLTNNYKLLSGKAEGDIREREHGRLALYFNWSWLSGEKGGGMSNYEEIS